MLTIFILLVGGLGVATQRAEYLKDRPDEGPAQGMALKAVARDLEADIFFLASGILSTLEEPNIVQANLRLKAALEDLFDDRYDPKRIEDHRFTVTDNDLEMTIKPMSVLASTCTNNISLSGDMSAVTLPTYYHVSGGVTVRFEDGSGKLSTSTHNITIDELVPNLSPFVSTRLDEFEANGLSEFTDIGRMVRYMLTTLVRYRTIFGYGSGPYDTEKDLLNEGDVELAVNLAVLLEEARLFGTYDQDAVAAIDHYFYYATNTEVHFDEPGWGPYNPTTLRPWGSAERKNYARFQNRLPQFQTRTLGTLFGTYVHEGLIDPADLMALYLNLDQYDTSTDVEPKFSPSLLHSKFLFDGRYPDDRRDPSHVEYMVDVGPRTLLFMDPAGDFGQVYPERLAVDHYPDYLTVGSEVKVSKEITTPYKWMTNTRLKEGSRTGGVPPPQPPPEHDWVMLWEFKIWGDFKLAVGRDPTYSLSDGSDKDMFENRTISLDIPINIFAPLSHRPMNSAVFFTNLNTGSPPGATYNFTYESIAYEHFSNSTWSTVKDVIDPVMEDVIRLVKGATCPYHGLISNGKNLTSLRSGLELVTIDQETWTELDGFVTDRLTGVKLSTQILKPFLNFEYFVDIDRIDGAGMPNVAYELRMTIKTRMGDVAVSFLKSDTGQGGWVETEVELKVDGLLDVRYGFDWNDDQTWLRPSGGGTIGGTWSVPIQEKGPTSFKGVYVETVSSFAMMIIPDTGLTGPTGQVVDAIPSMSPARTFLPEFMEGLKAMSSPSMTLLFSDGSSVGGWHGFKANDARTVDLVLDWIIEHADGIVALAEAGRIEASALGMAAEADLGSQQQLEVRVYKGEEMFTIPMMHFSDASQMFQRDILYEPLTVSLMTGITHEYEEHPTKMAATTTFKYTEYYEIFIDDLEGPNEG